MSDIVERCQRGVVWISPCVCDGDGADDLLKEAAAEITRLRTELAEAQAAREQTIKNWEADIRAMNANRDTLRTELAEAQADIDHQKIITEQVQLDYQGAVDERDTLRQQLAVAREGLGEIKLTDIYARAGREEKALKECGNIARDTLAKLEKP
jgi:chromosome segregation ATPase